MDKIINKRQAVCGTLWIMIICMVVTLWPLRLVNEKIVSGSNRQISMCSEAITEEYVVQQMFIAQYDYLQNIKVYLLNESAGEEFNFILYDAQKNRLMQQVVSTDEMKEAPGFCTVQVNLDVEVGKEYYYLIQGISTDIYVAYEDTADSGTIYNGTLYYGDTEDKEHNVITEYEYKVPLRKGATLVCDVLLVLLGLLVSVCAKKYNEKYPDRNGLLTVEAVWKRVGSIAVAVLTLAAMAAVWPLQLFAREAENILFLDAGILLAAGIALYGINHNRAHKSHDMGFAVLKDRWTDYLQAAFFALAIQAGVHYLNGLYEIHHTLAYREMLIYFGLAVIVTYKRKEILNAVNLVYLAAAAVTAYFYYQEQTAALGAEATDEELRVVKLTVWAGVIAGIVIINTVSMLVRGQLKRSFRQISVWYGTVLAVFFALLILFRNTRGWPIYLVCAYTLYYLRMSVWEKRERQLQNICNGILLHFMVMAGYCLLHRPYMFYRYYRYPFVFHTVTISAVYLSLAVCAALVKLLDAYRRNPRVSCIWKELTVFGIAVVYLIFTLSRTGYLAVGVMALVVIPLICLHMQGGIKPLLKAAAMMAAAVVLCFPAVFAAQRVVPAAVAQPEVMEIEELPSEIVHGRNMDSYYYMTIRRFIHVFELKVLGIPEEKCINQYNFAQNGRTDGFLCKNADEILVASTELSGEMVGEGEAGQQDSDAESYANGRIAIFRLYIENLNKEGHDDMSITLPDGNIIGHAHNIYLQAAFDHGIPVGVYFLFFGFCTLVQAALYYRKRKEDRKCSILPLSLLLLFAVAGLTEWIFHPCYPIAFCLLLALAPLVFDTKADAEGIRRNGKKA